MLTAIKACKYLLPCGHCDKFDNVCTQYGSIDMTLSGDSITAEELRKYSQEQYDLWLNSSKHTNKCTVEEKNND